MTMGIRQSRSPDRQVLTDQAAIGVSAALVTGHMAAVVVELISNGAGDMTAQIRGVDGAGTEYNLRYAELTGDGLLTIIDDDITIGNSESRRFQLAEPADTVVVRVSAYTAGELDAFIRGSGVAPPFPFEGQLLHARKTVTFANSTGDVPVFDRTGRVRITHLTAFCTDGIVEDGDVTGIELGTTADRNVLMTTINPSLVATNEWWVDGSAVSQSIQMGANQIDVLISSNIIITITLGGGTDLDSGTIVFDVWYVPVTDDGRLVAA